MGLFDFFSSSPAGSSSSSSSSPSPPPIPSSLPSPPALQPSAPEVSSKHITALNPQGIKPCCACPETKIPRDDCFLRYGHEGLEKGSESEGEGWRCRELVEEHRRCMAKLGFKI